jgi:hypothetical protein
MINTGRKEKYGRDTKGKKNKYYRFFHINLNLILLLNYSTYKKFSPVSGENFL